MAGSTREGSLEAPTRHAINWKDPSFYDEDKLYAELERVFDICHGCRRCVSLCNSFPTLFDLVDESSTMEVDGVDKSDYMKVIDHCYLCDLCYLTKCPYVPPHEWNVDFPHLMLRAKALKFNKQKPSLRDRTLSATDTVGKLAGLPLVSTLVNASNKSSLLRTALHSTFGIHRKAKLPEYHNRTFRKNASGHQSSCNVTPGKKTRGKVVLYSTCYGNYNEPELNKDLLEIFEHNKIPVSIVNKEKCCGMPKLELGDLDGVESNKNINIPILVRWVDEGFDIVAPIPSCVLMYKQELPLMFPDDADVIKVANAMFDPFEYLALRHKDKLMNTDFKNSLGKVVYHAACHLRVQKIGLKTRDLLSLIPDTELEVVERCSGHDGTYAVKVEFHNISMKICRPVVDRVKKADARYYSSDCPMAGHQIANGLDDDSTPVHPLHLLRIAYGI